MITEDYVSFETAKLLKEKGFDDRCRFVYIADGTLVAAPNFMEGESSVDNSDIERVSNYNGWKDFAVLRPSLQVAMKWLRETYSNLLIVDYDYECTDTSYCFKIYRLGEYGKPESVAVKGVSYDKDGNPTEHIAFYRDYERSYSDYGTYEEACEAGIRYVLENLI